MTNAEAFKAAHALTTYTIRMEREIAAAEGRAAEACDYRATFGASLKAVYALRNEGCTIALAGSIGHFINHIDLGVPWAATLALRATPAGKSPFGPPPSWASDIIGMLGTGNDIYNAA